MTIYPFMSHGRTRWRLTMTVNGVRRVATYKSKAAAEVALADAKATEKSDTSWWASLTQPQRIELSMVAAEIARAGLSLRQVWEEHKQRKSIVVKTRTLRALADEVEQAKLASGRRKVYVAGLAACMAHFIRGREEMDCTQITTADVEEWIASRKLSAATRVGQVARISVMFQHAVTREYRTKNPCDAIETPRLDHAPPRILTVRESARIMVYVRRNEPEALAWFALALFAGIRPHECDRLTWSAVNLDEGIVTVDAAASKVRFRRIVHLLPVAVAWLRVARKAGATLPMSLTTRRRALRRVRDGMRWSEWPADILRHTAASMLMALHQDAGKVADELGNSVGVLLNHYRELVNRDVARRWANLIPKRWVKTIEAARR